MNKKILFILFVYLLGYAKFNAQIGVNTSNPQGIFHIDGAKDNAITGVPTPGQQSNDVTVSSSGNVGIGTVTPSAKLEVISSVPSGAIRIIDSSEGAGKMLISDANGAGTWSTAPAATKAVVTATTASAVTTSGTQGTISYIPNLRIAFPVSGYYSLSINPHVTNAGTARDSNGYVGGLYLRNTTTLATVHIGVVNIPPGWPYGNYGFRFSSYAFQYIPSGTYELGVTTLSNATFQQTTYLYTPLVGDVLGILLAH
ncbi:hypothetical protein [Chryseobacterium bernardetii]|uniref:hypothetical protein n=1 Tax=Chryseobacterium bernardetii TaxID=1241978 RepID=UPI003AF4ECA7